MDGWILMPQGGKLHAAHWGGLDPNVASSKLLYPAWLRFDISVLTFVAIFFPFISSSDLWPERALGLDQLGALSKEIKNFSQQFFFQYSFSAGFGPRISVLQFSFIQHAAENLSGCFVKSREGEVCVCFFPDPPLIATDSVDSGWLGGGEKAPLIIYGVSLPCFCCFR